MTETEPRPTTRLLYTDIGTALGTDDFLLRSELTAPELDYLYRTRRFVHDDVLPVINGVQAGLAMRSIAMHGSEAQKQRWLPAMARCEQLGGSPSPRHGSDSGALETEARGDGDSYVINGAKRWIGNGTLADVVVLWARDTDDMQVKGSSSRRGHSATTPG